MLELTGRALESGRNEFTLLNTLTGRTTELTGRGTPGARFEYKKGPERIFVDRTRHHIRSTPHVLLSLWAPNRTRRWQTLVRAPLLQR
jgi:hypothetical protein